MRSPISGAPGVLRAGVPAAVTLAVLAVVGAVPAAAAPVPGTITTVAGGGTGGDGVIATAARLRKPRRVAPTADGGLLIVEFGGENTYGDGRVRKVLPDGTITTVAGDGIEGFSGDGGPATEARMNGPTDIAVLPDGAVLVVDEFNHRVRRIEDGTITTVAGAGGEGCGAQSGLAIDAEFTWPRSLAVEDGGYLLLDEKCGLVHRISEGADGEIGTADDTVQTVAGLGGNGFAGDGGPGALARFNAPRGIAALPGGGFLVADSLNQRVRRVGPDGVITTVAGTGANAFGADGGAATATPLATPRDVAALPDGGFLIAESGANRIRRVLPGGVITTVAGTGSAGSSGDGGPATAARITEPHGVNVTPEGDVYISGPGLIDTSPSAYRVRRVQGPLPPPGPVPGPDPGTTPPGPRTVTPPVVEAPPGPQAAAPAAVAAAAGLHLRLRVVRRHRVRSAEQLDLRLTSDRPLAGRGLLVQVGRQIASGGRTRLVFRTVNVVRPLGRVATVRVRIRGAGRFRVRLAARRGPAVAGLAGVTLTIRRPGRHTR